MVGNGLEQAVRAAVQAGDPTAARVALERWWAAWPIDGAQNLVLARAHAAELIAALAHWALEAGAEAEDCAAVEESALASIFASTQWAAMETALRRAVEALAAAVESRCSLGPAIRRAVQYLAAHYGQKLTRAEVAAVACMSVSQFSWAFKEQVGVSFSAYLTALRLERAKQLLAETDLSLGAIAEKVGYRTEAYFCAVFKRAEGVSPGAYRHRLVGDRVTG